MGTGQADGADKAVDFNKLALNSDELKIHFVAVAFCADKVAMHVLGKGCFMSSSFAG